MVLIFFFSPEVVSIKGNDDGSNIIILEKEIYLIFVSKKVRVENKSDNIRKRWHIAATHISL